MSRRPVHFPHEQGRGLHRPRASLAERWAVLALMLLSAAVVVMAIAAIVSRFNP